MILLCLIRMLGTVVMFQWVCPFVSSKGLSQQSSLVVANLHPAVQLLGKHEENGLIYTQKKVSCSLLIHCRSCQTVMTSCKQFQHRKVSGMYKRLKALHIV